MADTETNREALKASFIAKSGFAGARREALPGDASTRRYERLWLDKGQSLILMDQASGLESKPCPMEADEARRCDMGYNAMARLAAGRIEAFVACAEFLNAQGLSAPKIHALDSENGFLISEDLGDGLFARLIEQGTPEEPLYLAAVEALAQLHKINPPKILNNNWPLLSYDALALKTGCDLFVEWYPRYGGLKPLSDKALSEWYDLWQPIITKAGMAASVFIHRDYHAENLLWLPEREGLKRVGMIDFQDALLGHPSWDLLSLLQDARRDVSKELETKALNHYFSVSGIIDRTEFMHTYHALASLNEARILGIFARLVYRDHKPKFAQFIPRMWRCLSGNLNTPELAGLKDWFIRHGFGANL